MDLLYQSIIKFSSINEKKHFSTTFSQNPKGQIAHLLCLTFKMATATTVLNSGQKQTQNSPC